MQIGRSFGEPRLSLNPKKSKLLAVTQMLMSLWSADVKWCSAMVLFIPDRINPQLSETTGTRYFHQSWNDSFIAMLVKVDLVAWESLIYGISYKLHPCLYSFSSFPFSFHGYILLGDAVLLAPSILTATKLLLESELLKIMKIQFEEIMMWPAASS